MNSFPAKSSLPEGTFRLVSFNMQHGTPSEGWDEARGRQTCRGFSPSARQARDVLEETARILGDIDADIVLLQEVDRFQVRSAHIAQDEFFAQALGLPFGAMGAIFAGHAHGFHRPPFSRSLEGERGYGVALLSRFPIEQVITKPFPYHAPGDIPARFRIPSFIPRTLARVAYQQIFRVTNRPRVLQAARIITPWGTVAVGNVHLENNTQIASSQLPLAWRAVCASGDDACVVAGDFNVSFEQAAETLGAMPHGQSPDRHYSAVSFPARKPRSRFDQLVCRGMELCGDAYTVRLASSDHLAVVYDVRLTSVSSAL